MRRLLERLHSAAKERSIVLVMLGLLVVIRSLLVLLPFDRFRHLLGKILAANSKPLLHDRGRLNRMIKHLETAGSHLPAAATCLTRAVAAQILYSFYGQKTSLRIGVSKSEKGRLKAHAWLQVGERVTVGQLDDLDRFVRLPGPW